MQKMKWKAHFSSFLFLVCVCLHKFLFSQHLKLNDCSDVCFVYCTSTVIVIVDSSFTSKRSLLKSAFKRTKQIFIYLYNFICLSKKAANTLSNVYNLQKNKNSHGTFEYVCILYSHTKKDQLLTTFTVCGLLHSTNKNTDNNNKSCWLAR